ncbi:hypothetical protein [Pseudomonas sp. 25571]|uniref:hypothetical protein n=1 Tax=Pseudomonas sp. 25571 TaxID=2967216 RepID=UPI002363C37A|nr:hypothetical protein [Pseudomonas sp. 25571]MDD2064473.1 hypothetical protein [Pseudomonas sp. 25571]
MSDSNPVEIEFHEKRLSDFDLLRIARASDQEYEDVITAYLTSVQIHGSSAVGVVFGHTKKEPSGRFADGHLIRTSDILLASKEGKFWVITTIHSRYVVATFRRDGGRRSLRDFCLEVGNRYPNT